VTGNRFTWGDEVRVVSRDGLCASVCAITERLDGGWRYLVEFNDGSAIELDEEDLRRP